MKRIILLYLSFSLCFIQSAFSQKSSAPTIKLLFTFGTKGVNPGQFQSPMGISTDVNGNIYVADTGNNRIQKFDSRGSLVNFIGGFGWGSEQFQRPTDICAENALDVFVSDYENNRIERYDKDLNWITSYKNDENLPDNLQYAFPNSVSISIHGDLFIVTEENKRILKINTLREPEFSFGDFDWGKGSLSEPAQVYISKSDKIYVTDQKAGSIFVYDYYGNFLFQFGNNILGSPGGICVDQNDLIYVTDLDKHKIVIFDASGHSVVEYGSFGDKYGAFNSPSDVAVFQNKIYVTDMDNHRVQVFQLDR